MATPIGDMTGAFFAILYLQPKVLAIWGTTVEAPPPPPTNTIELLSRP